MSITRVYVTYFDQRYLARGLVMAASLRRHDPLAVLFVLCLDAKTHQAMLALGDPAIAVVTHEEIVAFEPRLQACAARPRAAFYATHKPVLPLYVFSRWPRVTEIVHIDADALFFASPAPLFDEAPEASILVSPHRYPSDRLDWAQRYGVYNAGFIAWRRDEAGLACLGDYRERCLERVEPDESPGRFMNQGYLDAWPEAFTGVHALAHPGANLAPWNLRAHTLEAGQGEERNEVWVNGRPLIFFHFSAMFRDADGCWRTEYLDFGEANLAVALVKIYRPYFAAVEAALARLNAIGVYPEHAPLPEPVARLHYLT